MQKFSEEEKYLVALSSYVFLGPARIDLILKYFGTSKKAWNSSKSELKKIGLTDRMINGFFKHKRYFDMEKYFDQLKKRGIKIVFKKDLNYPGSLKEIASAPTLIYVKGKLPRTQNKVSIVGSRKMTEYGKKVALHFSYKLASKGVVIVSGLARGVDTQAHLGTLRAKAKTIAVLGCGLDYIYPPENKHLSERISKNGCLISEYPLGYPIRPQNFAARNRIISGLSSVVLVVEGRMKSGTFLTVKHALDQGKSVFAVPGQINSKASEGPLFLIKEGAQVATCVGDVLEELKRIKKLEDI